MVAIIPAYANTATDGATRMGTMAGFASALAVGLKYSWGYEDSLDVLAVHVVFCLTGPPSLGFIALPLDGLAVVFLPNGGFCQFGVPLVAFIIFRGFAAFMTSTRSLALHITIDF